MQRRFLALAFAGLMCLSGASRADVSLGLRAGTLGLGGELSYAVSQRVALRLGADTYSPKTVTLTQQDIDYDAKAKLRTGSLLIDWFPFANNFRISLGAMVNQNKVTATGKPAGGSFTLNGQTFNAADVGTLSADVTFKRSVPYFGFGYGRPINGGLSFISDLGVMFQGSPKATLSASCGGAAPPGSAQCDQIRSAVAGEEATVNDDIAKFKYYPVFSIGLAYTF